MLAVASDIARTMTEDFYNHVVDDTTLIVIFKDRYFVLDKFDTTTWKPMGLSMGKPYVLALSGL